MTQLTDSPKILIVDDTPHNLGVLFDYLNHHGFKVFVAVDGKNALEQVQYSQPDLILLDVMMPKIDGFEVCKRLKENPLTQDIPVIFMTVLSEIVDKVKGFEIGGVDYVTKPIQHEEVLSRIKTHLMIRNLQRELQEKNTELARINQNLEQLVQEKTQQLIHQEKSVLIGRMTQGIVHNIKNPIQVLMLSLGLLEVKINSGSYDSLSDLLQKMSFAIEKVTEIINKLMRKSRWNREKSCLNINDVLQQELDLFQENLFFKNRLKKIYNFDENLPILELNISDVSQVFDNLIDNAIDAMWNCKTAILSIKTYQDDSYVYIDFTDTGCGISAQNIPTIFEPFYTTKPLIEEKNVSDEPTGTGLGLYSCLEILKSFGGEIQVKSEIDKGSTFTVILPKSLSPSSHSI